LILSITNNSFCLQHSILQLPVSSIAYPPSGIGDLSLFWLSCLYPSEFLFPKTFILLGFELFWPWAYLMKVIQVLIPNIAYYMFLTPTLHNICPCLQPGTLKVPVCNTKCYKFHSTAIQISFIRHQLLEVHFNNSIPHPHLQVSVATMNTECGILLLLDLKQLLVVEKNIGKVQVYHKCRITIVPHCKYCKLLIYQ
jgi:hypothetical protein